MKIFLYKKDACTLMDMWRHVIKLIDYERKWILVNFYYPFSVPRNRLMKQHDTTLWRYSQREFIERFSNVACCWKCHALRAAFIHVLE